MIKQEAIPAISKRIKLYLLPIREVIFPVDVDPKMHPKGRIADISEIYRFLFESFQFKTVERFSCMVLNTAKLYPKKKNPIEALTVKRIK